MKNLNLTPLTENELKEVDGGWRKEDSAFFGFLAGVVLTMAALLIFN